MIVDCERHYIPEKLIRKKGLQTADLTYVERVGLRSVTVHPTLYDMDAQLKDMAQAGIDVSILSCVLGWDAPPEDCRLINDELATLQRRYPDNLAGLAHIPVLAGEEGIEECRRAVRELNLHGVTIASQVEGLPLDSPRLFHFYAVIEELDVPIYVHPAVLPAGYALTKEFDLGRILGREIDLTVAVTRIIAGGVLERFPGLTFVISHFGGGIAAVKDRLVAKAYRFGTLERPFQDSFDMLYFNTAGAEGGLTALRCALLGIRPDRLVFGTDYPQDFTGVNTNLGRGVDAIKRYIETIQHLDLPEDVRRGILGQTASRLFKVRDRGRTGN